MSENFLIAIIGLAGAFIFSLIGAFGTLAASEKKDQKVGCGMIGFAASSLGAIGLILSVLFAAFIIDKDEPTSSSLTDPSQEADQAIVSNSSNNSPQGFSTTNDSSRAVRIERQETGAGNYQTYTVTLGSDEALFGDAVDVENQGYHCVAFWAKGPTTITFSVLDGAWDSYSNVISETQLQELLQIKHGYLQNQHWYCKNVDVPIYEIRE